MFRITCRRDHRTNVLELRGKVTVTVLGEIRRAIEDAAQDAAAVLLDLSEVTLVDRHSVQFLSGQPAAGVELVNSPVYLERWLSPRHFASDGRVSDRRPASQANLNGYSGSPAAFLL